jgi:hypothetical protein
MKTRKRSLEWESNGIKCVISLTEAPTGEVTTSMVGLHLTDDDEGKLAVPLAALQSSILTHAEHGIDVTSIAYMEGIEDAVQTLRSEFAYANEEKDRGLVI